MDHTEKDKVRQRQRKIQNNTKRNTAWKVVIRGSQMG